MSYELDLSRMARKHLDRLRPSDHAIVRQAIDDLMEDPRPHGYLKLKGFANQYRIDVRHRWRVIYSIWDKLLRIEIIDVDDRKDIYRK